MSIVRNIQHQLPFCSIHYVFDNALCPYGDKENTLLVERMLTLLSPLVTQLDIDIIIIACNTASIAALPTIRKQFSQTVIGVVPAIKPAARDSKTKAIALLATPNTTQSHYTQQLINDFAHDCNITRLGSTELVELAESSLYQTIDIKKVDAIVSSS